MPVKNTATFLADCLESILQQTEKHWELIAINDHSTDESLAILTNFAQKDTRIQVFNNTGTGIINALRVAYSKSSGQFITRMDSDDLMMPEKLKVLKTQLLENGNGHLALGQVQYFSSKPLGNGYQKYQDWLNRLSLNGNNYQEIYKECVIPSPCWMVYKADLDKCEAFLPDRYPEDYDLCFRFYENQLKIIPAKQILHQWRDYPTRTSRTDNNYADNRFLAIKLHYFLKLDIDIERPLILWGAGKKGKWLAQQLVDLNQLFYWICNNEKKIGKDIYGQILLPINSIQQFENPQYIISVAGEIPQRDIKAYFIKQQLLQGKDYFFFC